MDNYLSDISNDIDKTKEIPNGHDTYTQAENLTTDGQTLVDLNTQAENLTTDGQTLVDSNTQAENLTTDGQTFVDSNKEQIDTDPGKGALAYLPPKKVKVAIYQLMK